jgi:DNA-binding transcriptional regulator GbsR (MarR family)
MLSEAGAGLARCDRTIEETERNVRALEALIPQMAAKGYATDKVREQIQMLTQMLSHLKTQRWEIEGMLGQP